MQNKILVVNESTMLPLREVSTLIGTKVDWNPQTKLIIITHETSKEMPSTPKNEEAEHIMLELAQIVGEYRHSYNDLIGKYINYLGPIDYEIIKEQVTAYEFVGLYQYLLK